MTTKQVYSSISQSDQGSIDERFDRIPSRQSSRWKYAFVASSCLLLVSLSFNTYHLWMQYLRPWEFSDQLKTRFAHLQRNVPTEILSHSDYSSLNRTIQDAAWNDRDVEPWNGFLALTEDYSTAHDLPHSQRWPWDANKGVYIMTSSHELHCVRVLRIFVNENHDGVKEPDQTWHYPHVMHCLNLLRESVMCNADDTPLYIGRLHGNILEKHPRAGTGTVKMCRDWNKLLAWSRAHSACYRPDHWFDPGYSEIERYKTCPDGARPWESQPSM